MDEEVISLYLYHDFYQFMSVVFIIFLFINDAEELGVQLSSEFGCLQALCAKGSFSLDCASSGRIPVAWFW